MSASWIGSRGSQAERTIAPEPPLDWRAWLQALFPRTYTGSLAPYHEDFWRWLWSVEVGVSPAPYVTVWPRGWAKSTSAECGAIALGARGRRYAWYVSSVQAQADAHVLSIAIKLESSEVERYYPALADRQVGKFGNSRGWNRTRLATRSGYVVDAIGLDAAIRGVKFGDDRPDVILFDDVDEDNDSPETIIKKVNAVTKKILPAGAPTVAVMVLQNLVHRNGIVSQLVDGRADYLARRIVSGPHPAVLDMEWEGDGNDAVIVGGTPTWSVMGLAECQAKIALFGLRAFRAECQHEVELSGQPRFDLNALALYRAEEPLSDKSLPAHLRGIEGLRVYTLPIPGVAYVIYIDAAEGKGRDYTATVVMEARTKRIVAILEDNHREPQTHGNIAVDLWEWYNRGLFGFERANAEAIALVLGARGVSRIYQHVDNPLTPQQRAAGIEEKRRPGFPMTAHSKRGLIDRVAGHIEAHAVSIPDRRMLEQCRSYVVTERMTTEAEPGGHDDLVIALAGCDMLSEQPGAQSLQEQMPRTPPQQYGWVGGGQRAERPREHEDRGPGQTGDYSWR